MLVASKLYNHVIVFSVLMIGPFVKFRIEKYWIPSGFFQ